jgi:hypothetical protein
MSKTKLQTTPDELSEAWEAVSNLRTDAQVVKVRPIILQKLLHDHQTLFALAKDQIENV